VSTAQTDPPPTNHIPVPNRTAVDHLIIEIRTFWTAHQEFPAATPLYVGDIMTL
jgi:hypothetical protein